MSFKCIGLLGDSIAQGYFSNNNEGWFGKFITKLTEQNPCAYSSQNMSVHGERTTDVYHRLHSEALTKNIDILFISVGINDLIRWESVENQTDLSEGVRDEMWYKILKTATKNIDQVIVTSILPVMEKRMPAFGERKRKYFNLNSDTEKYNEFLKDICKEYNVQFINLDNVWNDYDLKQVLADASHPNELGHQLVAEEIFKQAKLR